MALSRGELKQLVKEILVEVLSEGLGNVQAAAYAPPRPGTAPIRGKQVSPPRRSSTFDPRLDTPVTPRAPRPPPALRETIKREAAGNPIMAAILADTAATTLQEQLANERGGSIAGDAIPQISQKEQIHGTPEEVFGEETASRWADLAFMPSKKTA